ncbi:uncharacterized protein LOC123221235 [Mangifera indica]|uniref:uncharacterized protein LOC123221235 n=1 Tax=Mangifera indica TaxID=29780 RepID=UPI001CFC3560|nr:uncharacterized protein LOC123221235 [Mangifera indica]
MGCFLGCFGGSSKRKRRKPAKKVLLLPRDPIHGSYEPLVSSVSTLIDITENHTSSNSQHGNRIKIGKKVSFNLNVQTYEPLSKDETIYNLSESDGEDEKEQSGAETAKGNLFSVSEGNSTASKRGSFPPNYRYQNLTDCYEDEDDFEYNESDLDFDDDEGEDENEDLGGIAIDIDDQRVTKIEFLKQLNSQPEELSQGISWIHSAEDKSDNHIQLPGLNSILNPVDILTQWKAVKAKAASAKHLRKENFAIQQEPQTPFDLKTVSNLYPSNLGQYSSQSEPLLQEVTVNASLSNWLASRNPEESQATSISVENTATKRSMLVRSSLQESR